MTKKVVEFAKTRKAIFVKIDPDIIKKSYNYQNEEQKLNYDPEVIIYNYEKQEYAWGLKLFERSENSIIIPQKSLK